MVALAVIEAMRSTRRQWPELGPSMIHRCQITHRVPNCLGARAGKRGAYFYAPYIAQDHRHDHGGAWRQGTDGLREACSATLVSTQQQRVEFEWELGLGRVISRWIMGVGVRGRGAPAAAEVGNCHGH